MGVREALHSHRRLTIAVSVVALMASIGASIWTTDLEKANSLPKLIQAGIVTVNNIVVSDPRVPFGGVKNSGFGRELSRYGMLEFTNIKSVRLYAELVSKHHIV